MTAKEQAKKKFLDLLLNEPNAYYTNFAKFEKYLTEYCTELCREQRELCADSYEKELGYKYQILIDSILNAKMPEL